MKKTVFMTLGLLAISACSDDEKKSRTACSGSRLEADLDEAPWSGPAVDGNTGELTLAPGKRYIVSSTYGVPVPGSDGSPVTERYIALFTDIQTELGQQPGLFAVQLASSDACASGRTLAVWDSEESMYAFVTGPAHLAAMGAVHEVLKPGYAVTHWTASALSEVSYLQATREFAKELANSP